MNVYCHSPKPAREPPFWKKPEIFRIIHMGLTVFWGFFECFLMLCFALFCFGFFIWAAELLQYTLKMSFKSTIQCKPKHCSVSTCSTQ